ncbi:MAG: hypothetical protein AABM43_08570 [Actinomycetota bacterium]
MSKLRAEHLLPLACAGGCALLAASEFMNTFKFHAAGPTLEDVQTAADQHHYALVVLAAFALIALVIAVVTGSKPAATAVAICGAVALLIFLLIDLPDVGKVGSIKEVAAPEAKADPATGFWLELAGALVLAICGGALATLSSDQLRAFARSTAERRDRLRSKQQERHPREPRKMTANPVKARTKPRPAKTKPR